MAVGVSTALAIWILHQAGWLAAWDGVFYDRVLSWTTHWRDPQPKVLLLRMDREDAWSDTDAVNTLNVLNDLGARAIVFDFLPLQSSREFFQRAAELKTVVFGRQLRPDPDNPDSLRLDAWPAAAQNLKLPWGVVFLPPSLKGVYRQQQTTVKVGTNTYPVLESRVAMLCDPSAAKPPGSDSFLVNFVGGPGSLPNASLSRVKAGELIPEIVSGRVVLVGAGDGLPGLKTPVCGATDSMTFLEFQGNALQTLLDGTFIRPLSWGGTLALLMALGISSSLLYQRVNSLAGARLVLGILLACAGGAVATMWLMRLWPPLGTLVLAQVAQFGLTLVFKTRMTNRALNEMRLHVLNQISERFSPQDILLSPEYWDRLVSMISQTMEINRMVFFERVPQTPQLLEIKAVNCCFEDLQEQQRTLEADVFSLALSNGSPCRVSGMFKAKSTQEVEYVCPLIFDGEVFGMWVAGFEETKASAIPQLEAELSKVSQQIARLLHQRKRAAAKHSLSARLRAWFSAEKEDQAYQELKNTAERLEQYYDVLEAVLQQIGTAMIVYDFFGRVLKVNEPALALLRAESFAPARATALDFLRLVTGMDESAARDLLRNVLLENEPVSMSVKLDSQTDCQFLLRVYPLSDHKQAPLGRDAFKVRGIVCELIETTSLSTLASLKGVVADRLGVELRDHLAAIEMSAALLEMDSFSQSERREVLNAIHHKIACCVQVLGECQKYLGRNVEAEATDCFPLDALELLSRVCATFSTKAAERSVTLQMQQPRLMNPVLASTSDLERLFSTTIELLLKDAAENTALIIEVQDNSDESTFRFSNSGFGIPNGRLQQVLGSPENSASEELQVLREALTFVRKWAGSLDITSEVGRGYSVILRLRQFKFAPSLPSQPA